MANKNSSPYLQHSPISPRTWLVFIIRPYLQLAGGDTTRNQPRETKNQTLVYVVARRSKNIIISSCSLTIVLNTCSSEKFVFLLRLILFQLFASFKSTSFV